MSEGSPLLPPLKRRTSIFKPEPAKPTLLGSRRPSVADVQLLQERLTHLHELRVKRLLGDIAPLCDWSKSYVAAEQLAAIKNRQLKAFYSRQNELIERYSDIDDLLGSELPSALLKTYGSDLIYENPQQEHREHIPGDIESLVALGSDEAQDAAVKFTIALILLINLVLLGGKGVVVYLTLSMSLIASLVDSVLDLLSSGIIYLANSLSRKGKSAYYPVGTARLEPLGILVFSIIMIVSFLQVAQDSLSLLLFDEKHQVVKITGPSLAIMVITIVVKTVCFVACTSVNNSSIQALAEDSKTDIVFNTFSIIFPLIGNWLSLWWVDPLGALALCGYVIVQWSAVAWEHINNLTGATADVEDRDQILYCCMRFAQSIEKITALETYHVGDRINVEVDLVLGSSLELRDCHDIAESLQYAIETLPVVERCFVHIDYREGNFQGHLT